MRVIALDFETFFSDDFTLSKLSTEAYIRDPRFESHGAAIKWGPNTPAKWYDHRELLEGFARVDWTDVAIICHHAHFDGFILSHHYNVRPKFWFDTLSMARHNLGNHVRVGLDAVRKHFGIPLKTTPYNLFKGLHWREMPESTRQLVGAGAEDEVESIWKIFELLARDFPAEEYDTIDTTVRMFTEPVLRADTGRLAQIWEREAGRKASLLERLGVNSDELQSADKFAELLRAEGLEPDRKPGKPNADGSEKLIYAFAKTDPFMASLLEDEDDRIRGLAEARLGLKSTFLQSRVESLGWMASRGSLPVYLHMYGAHTTRWSGGDDVNWQNNNAAIEAAILPPDGYHAYQIDASQIECRLLNYVAGQTDKVDEFRNNLDPYVGVASQFAGFAVNKKDHPELRQAGKVVELQAGYGSGGPKIRQTLRTKAGILITPEEAIRYRDAYRETHPAVVNLWAEAGRMIARLAGGPPMDWGPVQLRDGRMYLPNGTWINYSTLEFYRDVEYDDSYWRLKTRRGWAKIYGAKLVENCLSADTLVLTDSGYKRIVAVTKADKLWDGERWVTHGGLVRRGLQETGSLDGVYMTADHRVLANHGWVRAAQAQGFSRAKVRLPDGFTRRGVDGAEAGMVATLRVWARDTKRLCLAKAAAVLRLHEKRLDSREATHARYVGSSSVCRMAVDVGALSTAIPCGVEKLRRARDYCMSTLARVVRSVLGRYGCNVSTRLDFGASRQQSRVQPKKLLLGILHDAGAESARKPFYYDPMGAHDGEGSGPAFGPWGYDCTIPHNKQMAEANMVYPARRTEPVFDIMNSGPQHRFVVLGDKGPFLVHNCVQALARVVISQAMTRIKRNGYRIINTKHDSMWILIPVDGREREHIAYIESEMRLAPEWLPGIPLDAEGHLSNRYSK